MEVWHIELGIEFEQAIAARHGKSEISHLSPVSPLVEIKKIAPMEKLKGPALKVAVEGELRRLFHDLPVNFIFVDKAPADAKRVVRVVGERQGMPNLMGIADGIDRLNRDQTHVIFAYLGSLIEIMRRDQSRASDPSLPGGVVFRGVTEREAGIALGVLVAHEIAHTLGARHLSTEMEDDEKSIMATGSAYRYAIPMLGKAKWRSDTALYLHYVLNGLPIPKWILVLADKELEAEGNDMAACPHCNDQQ